MRWCKVCGRSSTLTIKRYLAHKGLSSLWKDVLTVLNVNKLSIRLGFCLHCGFVYYRDFLSFQRMKAMYAAEARYKNIVRKEGLKKNREHARMLAFLEKNLPKASIQSILDVGSGDFQALLQIRSMHPEANEGSDYRKNKKVKRRMKKRADSLSRESG